MGAALWATAALSVFLTARIVPAGRNKNYLIELLVAIAAAAVFGLTAWRSISVGGATPTGAPSSSSSSVPQARRVHNERCTWRANDAARHRHHDPSSP